VALFMLYHCSTCCALLIIGRVAVAALATPIAARLWQVRALRSSAVVLVSLAAVSAFLGPPSDWVRGGGANIAWTCTALVLILGLAVPAGVAIAWCLSRPWAKGLMAQAGCVAVVGVLLLTAHYAPGPSADSSARHIIVSAPESQNDRSLAPAAARPSGLRGVVMIVIDALRADHVHCLDRKHSLTPNIDGLADCGVKFSQAISQGSWTPPSMAAVMTGRYPWVHRAPLPTGRPNNESEGLFVLADNIPTLAESLGSAGWSCAAFVENTVLCPDTGFHRGFHYYRCRDLPHEPPEPWWSSRLGEWRARLLAWTGYGRQDTSDALHELADDVGSVDAAVDWLQRHRERPFFCWIHLMAVHDYLCEGFTSDSLDGAILSAPDSHPHREAREAMAVAPDEERAPEAGGGGGGDLDRYPTSVKYDDLLVGRIVDALRESGVLEDTLVIVVADHGEELGDHGSKGHRETLYDELIRVPIVMAWPSRLPRGYTVSHQVRGIDLLPTVLDLAGVTAPDPIDGCSLMALINGDDGQHRVAFSRCIVKEGPIESVRLPPHKLIVSPGAPEPQLYDLVADPCERRDIAASKPAIARDLAAQMQAWREAIRTARTRTRPGRLVDPDEMRRKLKALGYLE